MAKQPKALSGQVAAITGAARGIGKATAEAFLRQGMKVAIGDLDVEEARRTAEALGGGDRIVALELNVTDRGSIEAFLDGAEERLGPVDVLVNNAGIMPLSHFWDEDDATAQRIVDINLHGVIFGTKAALRRMIPRRRGAIVNIASQAGLYGAPGGATYSASKFAVVGLTEAIRGELKLAGHDIQMSYVCPVVVNTELGHGTAQTAGVKAVQPAEVADAIVHALQFGEVDVHVPKSVKTIGKVTGLLPRRAAEGVSRALKADRVLFDADPNARRAYELRAARSEPGLEPADEQKQLTP